MCSVACSRLQDDGERKKLSMAKLLQPKNTEGEVSDVEAESPKCRVIKPLEGQLSLSNVQKSSFEKKIVSYSRSEQGIFFQTWASDENESANLSLILNCLNPDLGLKNHFRFILPSLPLTPR